MTVGLIWGSVSLIQRLWLDMRMAQVSGALHVSHCNRFKLFLHRRLSATSLIWHELKLMMQRFKLKVKVCSAFSLSVPVNVSEPRCVWRKCLFIAVKTETPIGEVDSFAHVKLKQIINCPPLSPLLSFSWKSKIKCFPDALLSFSLSCGSAAWMQRGIWVKLKKIRHLNVCLCILR